MSPTNFVPGRNYIADEVKGIDPKLFRILFNDWTLGPGGWGTTAAIRAASEKLFNNLLVDGASLNAADASNLARDSFN